MTDTGFERRGSAVFDRFARPLSAVARHETPWGFAGGLVLIVLLAVVLFASLSKSRTEHAQGAKPAPHPVAIAQMAPPPPVARVVPATTPVVAEPAHETSGRLGAPAMIVDLSDAPSTAQTTSGSGTTTTTQIVKADASAPPHNAIGNNLDDDTFASRVSQSQAVTAVASQLRDTKLIVPQGTVIPAILETGVNSDLPGFVRAVVSRDVHGFDGSTVLIPRGSKLIGQYRSAVAAGYSRAFVVWSRLLTPDAVSVDIGSPATDPLGRGGIEGESNSHFLQRFGSAILLSVLTAGLDAAVNSTAKENTTAIVIGTPQQANNVAAIALQKYIDVPTTITVPQGTPVRVFVSRDLDFSAVPRPKAP
ncbi:MAG TPA: type IV secretion system protein VirB10 [Rhizomicrobium sp.]|nr:type IV secretion system protein VirB10 [Rhizomicrobium sp.]